MSTLIIVVDLDCRKCYHKIRKILCQLQDHERIRTISFDDKSKTVTMVGPFDPQRLACKLRCKGGKVVRDVYIVDANGGGGGGAKPPPPPQNVPDDGPPAPAPAPVRSGGKSKNKNKNKNKQQLQPPPPQTERPPSPPPPPPPETAPGPPPPEAMMQPPPPPSPVHVHHHPPPPPDRGMSAVVPQPQYVEERPPRAELEPQPPMSPPPPKEMRPPMDLPPPAPPSPQHPPPPMPGNERPPMLMPAECVIPTVEIPSWPAAAPVGPCGCPCCAPCYQGYYEGCRCYCCGRLYGTTVRPLPAPCGAYRGCRTFSDDDPSAACSVM